MALLTLLAATVLLLSGSIGRVMVLSGVVAATEIVLGLGLAFETDAPAGAIIVLGSAVVYIFILTLRRLPRHPAADSEQFPSSSTSQGASR